MLHCNMLAASACRERVGCFAREEANQNHRGLNMTTAFGFAPASTLARGIADLRDQLRHLDTRRQRVKARRQEVSRIAHELESSTDRQLQDLGISRADIASVANGTYRRD